MPTLLDPEVVRLENWGQEPLQAALTAFTDSVFSISSSGPVDGRIASGDTLQFTVSFNPTAAGLKPGEKVAVLSWDTNAPQYNGSIKLSFSGVVGSKASPLVLIAYTRSGEL